MTKYFPSERSTALGIFVWGVLLVVLVLSFNAALENPKKLDILFLVAFWILVGIFMSSVWFGTGYYVSNGQLIAKIGPFVHSKIAIDKITEISKTNSWISAPATSLNRLAIKSNDMLLVMVSPEDQKGFIEALIEVNPDIHIDL